MNERSAARIRFRWLRAHRFDDGPMPWYKRWFAEVEWRVRYRWHRLTNHRDWQYVKNDKELPDEF